MTENDRVFQVSGAVLGPGEAELAELERLRERFCGHHIFHDVSDDRGIRYLAYGATIDARPHTIITQELAELRDELETAQRELASGIQRSGTEQGLLLPGSGLGFAIVLSSGLGTVALVDRR